MPSVDRARGAVGEASHRAEDALAPEGGAEAVEGRDRQHLGQLAAGEPALEAVLLPGHPSRPEGEAVHRAAGDVGGEASLGRELGALVVGEVERGRGVGLGQEAQGGGLAGAGEGDDAQRAGGVGEPRRDDGVLLGAGSQEGLPGHRAAGPGYPLTWSGARGGYRAWPTRCDAGQLIRAFGTSSVAWSRRERSNERAGEGEIRRRDRSKRVACARGLPAPHQPGDRRPPWATLRILTPNGTMQPMPAKSRAQLAKCLDS
jgi:hypothetical protein